MKPTPNINLSATSKPAMYKDSHVISKFKTKIRIIHIIPPEIIKTDVENFRELVQQLTGKPVDGKGSEKKTSSSSTKEATAFYPEPTMNVQSESSVHIFHRDITTESKEIWEGENSGSFIGGFGDVEGLIHNLTEFPLLPINSSSLFNIYGGMPLCQ